MRKPFVRCLLTIPISHFCEKARWSLERAGLDYVEERHVQGVHQIAARRAGGGRTVPVLVADEGVFAESEDIVRYADERTDEGRRLLPVEAGPRDDVVALCRRLDAGLGPDGRRLMYAYMLELREPMLRVNNQGVPAWEARAMSALWPLMTRLGRRGVGIGPATKVEDEQRVRRAFDEVAERLSDGRPHIFGQRFTAADLTFACLAAAVVVPPQYGVRLPQPEELPDHIARVIRRFREHPAGAYAMELFRTER